MVHRWSYEPASNCQCFLSCTPHYIGNFEVGNILKTIRTLWGRDLKANCDGHSIEIDEQHCSVTDHLLQFELSKHIYKKMVWNYSCLIKHHSHALSNNKVPVAGADRSSQSNNHRLVYQSQIAIIAIIATVSREESWGGCGCVCLGPRSALTLSSFRLVFFKDIKLVYSILMVKELRTTCRPGST